MRVKSKPPYDDVVLENLPMTIKGFRDYLTLVIGFGPTLMRRIDPILDRIELAYKEEKDKAVLDLTVEFIEKERRLRKEFAEREGELVEENRVQHALYENIILTEHRRRAQESELDDKGTGLLKWSKFKENWVSYLAHEKRERWAAFGFIDIREFKGINDTCGHSTGDKVIKKIADKVIQHLRIQDYQPGRYGGDEIGFLLPGLSTSRAAYSIAERFKNEVETGNINEWAEIHPYLGDNPPKVDVGIVVLRLGQIEERRSIMVAEKLVDFWFDRADQLMYQAKEQKSNKVYSLRLELNKDDELVEITD